MVDVIFIFGGVDFICVLFKNGRVLYWIREVFGYFKVIGVIGEVVDLVNKVIGLLVVSVLESVEVQDSYGVVIMCEIKLGSLSEVVDIVKVGVGFMEKFFYNIVQYRCWVRELDGFYSQVVYQIFLFFFFVRVC